MQDPVHLDAHRLERDVQNWLATIGEELLAEHPVSAEALDVESEAETLRLERILRVNRVALQGAPVGTEGGVQRARFLADLIFEASADFDPEEGEDEQRAEDEADEEDLGGVDYRAELEFELDIFEEEIPPDPSFEVISWGRVQPRE